MYRGKSPKPPRTPELALHEIVTHSEAWVRQYEEAWFDVPVKIMGEKMPVLWDASVVRGSDWLKYAIDATLQLAEKAMEAHDQLIEWRDQNAKLDAKQAKRKPAKKSSRRKP